MFGLALCLLAGAADADPPEGVDMSLAPWFRGLQQRGTGMSCCSIADRRQSDFRITGNHCQARIDGRWRDVPAGTVLDRSDNPTGRAVVRCTPYLGTMCFIKGPGT